MEESGGNKGRRQEKLHVGQGSPKPSSPPYPKLSKALNHKIEEIEPLNQQTPYDSNHIGGDHPSEHNRLLNPAYITPSTMAPTPWNSWPREALKSPTNCNPVSTVKLQSCIKRLTQHFNSWGRQGLPKMYPELIQNE